MEGIVIIVIIAAVVLLLLLFYDKRNSIINFFKSKVFKPKELKVPKVKKPTIDTDTIPNEDNIDYGRLKMPEQTNAQASEEFSFDDTDNIFSSDEQDDEDDIDLDKIFEDLRIEQAKKGNKKFKSEMLDEVEPNFDAMSMEDLDTLLEDKFSSGRIPDDLEALMPSYNSNLSGEELGRAIKNLPPQLKILIASDILKRKF